MLFRLFLLFTSVTLIELYLILFLWRATGPWVTLALVFGTGILGAWIARAEGLRVLLGIRRKLETGQIPADEMIDGVILLLAGALLLTPGMLTDIVGLLGLLPPVRAQLRERAKARFRRWADRGTIVVDVHRRPPE